MSGINRRRFLEDSLLASAAAAAATVGASELLAKDISTTKPSKSANDRLIGAVIGAGGRGGEHIKEWLDPKHNVEIAYICDADINHGNGAADRIAKKQERRPKVVQDLRKLLEDNTVNFVSIATPNHWHSLAAIWAMQAGKDVYVEKPVSHNVSEGRRDVETAAKHNRICQAGTQSRSSAALREAMDYMRAGKLGEVKLARALCYKRRESIGPKGNYPIPKEVDYDLVERSGPDQAADPQAVPLRLALAVGLRQRRHRQPGHPSDGHRPPRIWEPIRWPRACYPTAADSATKTPAKRPTRKSRSWNFLTERRSCSRSAAWKPSLSGRAYGKYLLWHRRLSGRRLRITVLPRSLIPRESLVTTFHGGGDHFGNFLGAVRSRNPADLNAHILDGHLSSALCHLGNIGYRLGDLHSPAEALERLKALKTNDNVQETLDRVIDSSGRQQGQVRRSDAIADRRLSAVRSEDRNLREQLAGRRVPDARISLAVRRADGG